MDLLRVSARFQKQAQKRSRPRSRRGPLARLRVNSRDKLLERIIGRADFPQLVGDLSEELLRGTAAIVLDVGQMGRRDVEVRGQSAQGEACAQSEPADLFSQIWWVHVRYIS